MRCAAVIVVATANWCQNVLPVIRPSERECWLHDGGRAACLATLQTTLGSPPLYGRIVDHVVLFFPYNDDELFKLLQLHVREVRATMLQDRGLDRTTSIKCSRELIQALFKQVKSEPNQCRGVAKAAKYLLNVLNKGGAGNRGGSGMT